MYGHIITVADAIEHLNTAFRTQLERAIIENAYPNASIPGDNQVRTAFYLLLEPTEQRSFFLRISRDRQYWPRLRGLMGTPPYAFLRPEDEHVIRAAGICAHRVHLAQKHPSITRTGEFANGHFQDAAGRMFKIISKGTQAVPINTPWSGIAPNQRLVLDMKLRGRRQNQKGPSTTDQRPVANSSTMALPRSGDLFRLFLAPLLRPTTQTNDEYNLIIKVDCAITKKATARTARIVCTVIEVS
jgi:hypothetical protein